MRRLPLLIGVAVMLVLAGCSAPTTGESRPDPMVDRLGWEDGYWHDDPIAVDESDGLNASEREIVIARTMARVEHIRQREFKRSVSVEVRSREEYREQYDGTQVGDDRWNEQGWEALFLIGEDESIDDAFGPTFTASVQGFYAIGSDEIVLVTDSETPTVDRRTLAHELVHALQDQQFGLDGRPQVQDRRVGRNGVVEGDANYVAAQYERRCGQSWTCLDRPARAASGGGEFNQGVFTTIYAPYAAGPTFVEAIRDRGGWDAVDALYRNYPASSEQIIHPEKYPDEQPRELSVPDRSNGRWERYDRDPVANTLGESAIYAMFLANGRIDLSTHGTYDYDHRLSAGWGGDRLVPYRNGDRDGYVWQTVWDTRTDAGDFYRNYRAIVRNRSTRQPAADTYVLPDSDPFGDAFRVTRNGKRVRIVNAPTVRALDGVYEQE